MKRKPPEHVNHERWLVSYADFITLLFAFFVVLYSSSQVDKRKAGRLALAIQVAFQELGVFQTSNTKIPLKDEDAIPFENVQVVENINKDTDLKRIVNPMKGVLSSASESQSLQEAQAAIQRALDPEIHRHEVTMSMRREGLVVSLKEMGFFDSGSATVRPGSLDAISRLAVVLKQRPENLRIEGHTDNIPIHTARFASNWELSTSRATDLIQLLIMQYGLPPSHLSAAGYGEFHPVADNGTPEGRAQNRRLDVVILAPFQPVAPSQQNGNPRVPEPAGALEPSVGHP
ncbi:MAG TPA: flagellar motor protein MotB [Candidatus Acidoferrum sp.]|jgi:chemotaxis protein MotB|nr:flagellar motor protein MotB [Candidatus Acidoferrum sp.]